MTNVTTENIENNYVKLEVLLKDVLLEHQHLMNTEFKDAWVVPDNVVHMVENKLKDELNMELPEDEEVTSLVIYDKHGIDPITETFGIEMMINDSLYLRIDETFDTLTLNDVLTAIANA